MKRRFARTILCISVAAIISVCALTLIGCSPFKDAPQGISEDTRTFTKIADERMYAEAEDYKGYIYKSGDEAFCFRFKEAEIEEGKEYPLVIFLHGMGDYGSDNSRHMYRSLIDSVKNYAPEECFVFMPQGVQDRDWSDSGILTGKGGMDKLYNECLDLLLETYPIDKSRVYLTGMSMGGHGTVWQATQHPDKYAALMPVCGLFYWDDGTELTKNLENIKDTPMWFFHSKNDDAVNFYNSTKLIGKLQDLGNNTIRSTWFTEPLHDITPLAYDNSEVWKWLFAQKLNK